MKLICKNLLIVAAIFFAFRAFAGTAVETQKSLVLAGAHEKRVEAHIEIAVSLPDYSEIDPVIFRHRVIVPYTRSKCSISIDSSALPIFLAELKNIPESIKPLTVGIEIKSNNIRAWWDENNDLTVSDSDVDVTIYKKRKWQINNDTKPTLAFTLEDVVIMVDDIDMDEQLIELSFDEILPKTSNDLFNEFMAGKRIEGVVEVETIDY